MGAETNGLKNKQVKGVIDALFGVASSEIKKNGNFKLAGMLNLKLKKKPHPSQEGRQPLHQGTLCLQSQACVEDSAGICHEEIEGGLELNFQMMHHTPCCFGGRSRQASQPLVQIGSFDHLVALQH